LTTATVQQQQQQQYPSLPPPSSTLAPDPSYKIVPKSELHVFYAKQFKKILSNANFHTWHNAVDAHLLKWTGVFICPCTGELFLSGRYPGAAAELVPVAAEEEETSDNANNDGNDSSGTTLCWYSKKMHAEHAAAARTLDCWAFRQQQQQQQLQQHPLLLLSGPASREPPYDLAQAVFRLPDTVPAAMRRAIYAQQDDIRRENQLPPWV
jgi:hypothetical protein